MCRGKIDATTGLDGKALCLSPRDDCPLPTIRRRNRLVTIVRTDRTLLSLRSSAADASWDAGLASDVTLAEASFRVRAP